MVAFLTGSDMYKIRWKDGYNIYRNPTHDDALQIQFQVSNLYRDGLMNVMKKEELCTLMTLRENTRREILDPTSNHGLLFVIPKKCKSMTKIVTIVAFKMTFIILYLNYDETH